MRDVSVRRGDGETGRWGDTGTRRIDRVAASPLPRVSPSFMLETVLYRLPGAGFRGNFSSRIAVL